MRLFLDRPSDRNRGWISWLWPKPISDTMSRKRRGGAQSLQSLHCSTSSAKHIRRQEGADAFFTDGGADHTECIARSAAVPGATDFRIGLQIVVELGPLRQKKWVRPVRSASGAQRSSR